jgi:hypothetical protein
MCVSKCMYQGYDHNSGVRPQVYVVGTQSSLFCPHLTGRGLRASPNGWVLLVSHRRLRSIYFVRHTVAVGAVLTGSWCGIYCKWGMKGYGECTPLCCAGLR